MRETGFEIPPDPEAGEKFAELHSLQKNDRPTGMLVLQAFPPHPRGAAPPDPQGLNNNESLVHCGPGLSLAIRLSCTERSEVPLFGTPP